MSYAKRAFSFTPSGMVFVGKKTAKAMHFWGLFGFDSR